MAVGFATPDRRWCMEAARRTAAPVCSAHGFIYGHFPLASTPHDSRRAPGGSDRGLSGLAGGDMRAENGLIVAFHYRGFGLRQLT